jgi:ABC-type nitrate/sulfonate/bicarbonate transport system, ATPase component
LSPTVVDKALLLGNEILVMENGKVGKRLDVREKVTYPRNLLSEEMIDIKRRILITLDT